MDSFQKQFSQNRNSNQDLLGKGFSIMISDMEEDSMNNNDIMSPDTTGQ